MRIHTITVAHLTYRQGLLSLGMGNTKAPSGISTSPSLTKAAHSLCTDMAKQENTPKVGIPQRNKLLSRNIWAYFSCRLLPLSLTL